MKRERIFLKIILAVAMLTFSSANAFGAITGDIDGAGDVDLRDAVMAIQVCAGMKPTGVHKENSVNDSKIGLAEAITALQTAASILWYKDADGDGYSDGTTLISFGRPSDIYYESAELIITYGDRDDSDSNIHPEVWYKDADGDGYSDGTTEVSESKPPGYYEKSELIAMSGDRNDNDPTVHPEVQEIIVSVSSPQLTTTVGYNGDEQTVISGGNYPRSVYMGKPVLPVIPKMIVLPDGHELNHIEVETGEMITLSGSHTVQHGQQPYPLLPDIHPAATARNAAIYGSDSPYPGRLYDTLEIQKLSGVSILMVNLNPMIYKPLSGSLSYYKSLVVKVVTNPVSEKRQNDGMRCDPSRVLARLEVANPEAIHTYSGRAFRTKRPRNAGLCNPADSYQYVLITSETVRDAETTMNVHYLIAHRQARGVSATIVTVEDIYAKYSGADQAEQVRNFIIDAYNNWETAFVLLGGDTNIIPMRKLWCKSWDGDGAYEDHIPSDLYYQCLDGNYNRDGDDRWGEPTDGVNAGEIDLLAEVYVGRASAEDAEEMANFVYKTLSYENDNAAYKRSALMAGEYLGFGGDSDYAKNSMEEIRLEASEHGYTTKGFAHDPLYTTDVLYHEDGSWDKSLIISKIDSDAYGIINHLGHADYDYVMKMYNSDAGMFGNSKFIFAYSQGGVPGNFEEDCIGERLTTSTRQGMAAVVFNSRYGWGTFSSTDGPSQRYNREFWDAYFDEYMVHLGELNADSHEDNAWRIDQDCMRWCYYESNLLGDPMISLAERTDGNTTTTTTTVPVTTTTTTTSTSTTVSSSTTTTTIPQVVSFPDENLDAAVRREINKPVGDITISDLKSVTSLSASSEGIENLEGIQHFTALTGLSLDYNQVTDVSALAGLNNLAELYLSGNSISNISALSGLTHLTVLALGENQLTDVSALSGRTNLTFLDLNQNQLTDVSALAGLTNLNFLVLDGNQLTDINALVNNSGINKGDYISLVENPLSTISCAVHIPQLESRDVTVLHDCP